MTKRVTVLLIVFVAFRGDAIGNGSSKLIRCVCFNSFSGNRIFVHGHGDLYCQYPYEAAFPICINVLKNSLWKKIKTYINKTECASKPFFIKKVKTRPGGQQCVLKPLFHFSFFYNFFIFHSPRRSFLPITPSSSSSFLPRQALSTSFRFRKRPFFIDLDESVTDGPTDQPTDKATYRDARTHLTRPYAWHICRSK